MAGRTIAIGDGKRKRVETSTEVNVEALERAQRRGDVSADVDDIEPVVYYPHEATPEIVEAHLRADKKLTPETAKALSELFRVAYQQFSKPGKD